MSGVGKKRGEGRVLAYLHQMQLGSGQGDQVFDSHEDVSGTSLSVYLHVSSSS